MKRKIVVTSVEGCIEFVEDFSLILKDIIAEQDKVRIDFVEQFTTFLIEKGFTFNASYNVADQMLVFSGRSRHDGCEIPRINIRFESGLQPVCYWTQLNSRRVNQNFSEVHFRDSVGWFKRMYAEYMLR